MIVVRDRQLAMFEHQARQRFEDEMVRSIAADFPPKFDLLGEVEVRRLIHTAIDEGKQLGIVNQGAIGVLVELMVQFGEKFQYSPDRAWANKILSHADLPDHIRVDLVRQRMMAGTKGRTLMPAVAAGT